MFNSTGKLWIYDNLGGDGIIILIYDVPDSSSLLNCSNTTVSVNTQVYCDLIPRKNYSNIYSIPFVINLVSTLDVQPILDTNFASFWRFNYFIGNSSGYRVIMLKTTPYVNFTIVAYTDADQTSVITCPASVYVGRQFVCSFSPKYEGKLVFSIDSSVILGSSAFLILNEGLYPSNVQSFFYFNLTATSTGFSHVFINSLNLNTSIMVAEQPDATSLISCSVTHMTLNNTIECFILPRRNNLTIFVFGSLFTVSSLPTNNVVISNLHGFSDKFNFNVSILNNFMDYTLTIFDGVSNLPIIIDISPFINQYSEIKSGSNALVFAVSRINNYSAIEISSNVQFYDSGSGGLFSAVYSTDGLLFATNFTSGIITGPIVVSNNLNSLPRYFNVWTEPDFTSRFDCPSTAQTGKIIICNITSSVNNAPVFTLNSFFAPVDAYTNGTFSVIQPRFGNKFQVELSIGYYTGVAYITALVNGTACNGTYVTIYAVPDATSKVECDDIFLPSGGITNCRYFPNSFNVPISALPNFIHLTSPDGELSSLHPSSLSNIFTFTYTVPLESDKYPIYDVGNDVSPKIIVYSVASADFSSELICPSAVILNQNYSCRFYPRHNSITTFPKASLLVMRDNLNTTFIGWNASSDSNLQLAFTPKLDGTSVFILSYFNSTIGNSTVQIGQTPDRSSTLRCDSIAVVGSKLNCTIVPKFQSRTVYTFASFFTISINTNISIPLQSLLSNDSQFSQRFSFQIIISSYCEVISIRDGVSYSAQIVPVVSALYNVVDLLPGNTYSYFIASHTKSGGSIFTYSSQFNFRDSGSGGTFSVTSVDGSNYGNLFRVVFTAGPTMGILFIFST